MNCIIPGRGIRAFGKAIYCLAKVGEELYIEALPDGLALKTVNGARSAFATFHFKRNFFHSYRHVRRGGGEEEEPLKCKISAKSCVSVFKALSTLEKTVDRCSFYLDAKQSKLVFVFHCRHGIVKTHNLGFQECEALQAVFVKDLCPNHIIGPSRIVSEVVANFPSNLDEVTMIAEPECVRLRNYIEDDDGSTRVSVTEVSLTPHEFDDYQIGVDVSVTFCLKELRALLVFTDAVNHCLSIRFEGPGSPVVFSLDDSIDYQADFVLATLLDEDTPSQPSSTLASASGTLPTGAEAHGRKRVPSGRHGLNGDVSCQNDLDQRDQSHPDDTIIDQSNTSYPPSHLGASSRPERQRKVSSKSAEQFTDVGFPSGSQFNNTRTRSANTPATLKSPSVAHVPPPPVDDYMDTEPSLPRTSIFGSKDRSVRSTRTEDVMDALFGDGNFTGVAEEGEGVSHKPGEEVFRKIAVHSLSVEERETSGAAALPERELDAFPEDFPFEDDVTNKVQPLCSSAKVTLASDRMSPAYTDTQDSLINDSGFLPSTPPRKKFKSSSVLFGMDLFGTQPGRSEVLAPDSEDDSD